MLSRRDFLASSAVGLALTRYRARAGASATWRIDFSAHPAGLGWPGFACVGVANLRREAGEGILEAGSDVFPNDPRPVAFAVDCRFADGSVTATFSRTGAGAGVVARRSRHGRYYAAILDGERARLVIVRRIGPQLDERASTPAAGLRFPVALTLEVSGSAPTRLEAILVDADGRRFSAAATDDHRALQGPGDPGVLATARTLFPSDGNEQFPALGNVHLLPYGTQEGQAFVESPAGQAAVGAIRERSTAAVRSVEVVSSSGLALTAPSVVAATTAAPGRGGATARVATDLPARVSIEVASRSDFRGSRRIDAGTTDDFEAAAARLTRLSPGGRAWWRARVSRRGRVTTGPVRSFAAMPEPGSGSPVTLAVAACAAQFGQIFDHLAAREPDAFVWQGDLNYPDTHGPLAQTSSGYAGIWRNFLANPRLAPIVERASFVGSRDDHDYGVQDAQAQNLKPFGLAPWDSLIDDRPYRRFSAGLADVWVLDQRMFKTPPDAPDSVAKTLLGLEQRQWLLRTLAGSRAPFKVICSPCTLSPAQGENPRDGNWSAGYTAERDMLLQHIAKRVQGTTIFITGDTHYTMVYDRDGLFEARPCPLDIPTPNDVTLVDPLAAQKLRGRPGVTYADDTQGHFALLEARAAGGRARLDLTLVRQDGAAAYSKRFEERLPREARTSPGDGESRRSRTVPAGPGARASGNGVSGASDDLPFTGGHPLLAALGGAILGATGLVARRIAGAREQPDETERAE